MVQWCSSEELGQVGGGVGEGGDDVLGVRECYPDGALPLGEDQRGVLAGVELQGERAGQIAYFPEVLLRVVGRHIFPRVAQGFFWSVIRLLS